MTEHELELRLRDWYRDHVDTLAGDGSPAAMRSRVLEIPSRLPVPSRATEPRRLILLAAAMLTALLVGGAIAIGAGLLRLPWLPDDPTERSDGLPGNGWVAYSAALTSWNTPGGPAVETPGGPARLILTAPDGASVQYIGDQPPAPGDPTDEWLSVRQHCPAFSPDGSHLAFAEQAVDESQGFPIPVDLVIVGLNEQGTWEETLRVRGGCPVWSPDGQVVAFARSGARRPSIGIAGLDGTTDRLPSPDGEALVITAVAWSPDGSALAVVDGRYPNGFSAEGRLWLVPVDGSDPTLLYEGHTPLDGIPAWSSDGNRIAFTASATPEPIPNDEGVAAPFEPDWRVLVVATGGGVAEEVGPGVGPAWSPQGDRLAYLDAAGRITVVDIVTDARQVIPDAPIPPGTELSDYNHEGGGGIWRPHPPHWSPDGKRLLFVGTDGTWGTSVLLSASPEGDEVPVAVSQTWVAEWLGDTMFSWQPVLDEP